VRVGWRATLVACVAVACGGVQGERRAAPGPPLRIWTPLVVRWETGHRRHLDFAIENDGSRTVAIGAPDPAGARIDVYAGPDAFRACGAAPSERATAAERVALAPGDRLPVRVDLEEACGSLAPGEYRFEVSYRAAELGGKDAFSGTLPTRYGQVIVARPAAAGPAVSRAGGEEEARPPPRDRRHGRAEPARARRGRRPVAPDAGGTAEPR
jgi:hypothetical protein